ncbi:LOW QUALITY PROTEIN: taste receptor type 2 member 40-like [Aptenodytes patagonicus]|uniref:LOW QUALITY PROTEIN: taste receptor type 2 member 40-like n=1 Tax=Aptenodytes patagonicus TaxID=9234 RepID=UPI003F9ED692
MSGVSPLPLPVLRKAPGFPVTIEQTQRKKRKENAQTSLNGVKEIQFLCFNYSSLWFAAWLSVFYCTKVASFTQSFFIWLKQRIPSLVLWMLITSSLFSFATSLPFAWDIYNVHDNFTAPLTMTNSSERRVTMKAGLFLLILLCNNGIALPLIVFVVSSILLIRSLWIHARQMQNNATGFRNPSLEAHIGAIKLVFSFLILYVTYFISLVLIIQHFFTFKLAWAF